MEDNNIIPEALPELNTAPEAPEAVEAAAEPAAAPFPAEAGIPVAPPFPAEAGIPVAPYPAEAGVPVAPYPVEAGIPVAPYPPEGADTTLPPLTPEGYAPPPQVIPPYQVTYQPPVYQTQVPYEAPKKKKKLFKRWWFWVIVLIAGALIVINSGGSSSGSSSGSSYIPTVSPYVRMVKEAKNSNYGITYGKAFDYFFSNTDWSSFTASTGEVVVEFEGRFTYDGSPATAKIQFVLDVAGGTFSAYHLSINGVAQNKLMMATLIKKAFETAYQYYY